MNNEFVFKLTGDPTDMIAALEKVTKEAKATGKEVDKAVTLSSDKGVKQFDTLISKFKEGQKTANEGGGIFGNIAGTLGQLATPAGAATAAIGALTAGFAATLNIGKEFEQNLAGVGAVTGLSGDALTELGSRARQLAKDFGTTASDQLKSFQGVLSKFGADLAKTPEQLQKVSENINTLAKAGGLDAAESMDTLANSMLQFGVNVADGKEAAAESTRFMNVLAASAKVGAAEIPQVGQAVLVAGVAAKQANVSFEETNAAIQVLAAGGKVGAEAGTALRNVLGKMAGADVIPKEALAKLKSLGVNFDIVSNKALPLADRLAELAKAQGDATAYAQVFGPENMAAASILAESAKAAADGSVKLKDWTKQMTGTSEASIQAATNMNTFEGRMKKLKANLEDFAIGAFQIVGKGINQIVDYVAPVAKEIFNTLKNGFEKAMPYIQTVATLIGSVLVVAINSAMASVRFFTNIFSTALEGLGMIFKPITDAFAELSGGAESTGGALDLLRDIFQTVANVASGILGFAIKGVAFILSKVVGTAVDFVKTAIKVVKSVYDWAASLDFVKVAIKSVVDFALKVVDTIKSIGGAIADFLGLVPETAPVQKAIEGVTDETKKNTLATEENKAVQTDNKDELEKRAKALKALEERLQRLTKAQIDSNNDAAKGAELARQIQISLRENALLSDQSNKLKQQANEDQFAAENKNLAVLLEQYKVVNAQTELSKFANKTTEELSKSIKDLTENDFAQLENIKLKFASGIGKEEQAKVTEQIQDVVKKLVSLKIDIGQTGIQISEDAKKKLETSAKNLSKSVSERLTLEAVLTPETLANIEKDIAEIAKSDLDVAKDLTTKKEKLISDAAVQRRELQISLIKDQNQRELEEKIYSIEKQRDAEVEKAKQVGIDTLAIAAKYNEQIEQLRKNGISGAANKTTNAYAQAFKSLAKLLSDEIGGAVDSINNKLFNNAASIADLYSSQLDSLTKIRDEKLSQSQNDLSALDKESQALEIQLAKRKIGLEEYSNQRIELERKREELSLQIKSDGDLRLQALQDSTNEILKTKLNEFAAQNAKAFEDNYKAGKTSFDLLGFAYAGTVGSMIASGQSLGSAMASAAFDALQALVPVIVAQITGLSLAQPDSVATFGATAAPRIALLTGLFQAAISIARSALRLKDGVVDLQGAGTGTSDSIPARLSRGESVMRADITRRERPLLNYLHDGGTSRDFFAKNYSAVVTPSGELQYQTLNQLAQVNRRLERVESAIVTSGSFREVNMKVEHDESLIFKSRDRFTNIRNARY